jgi:predicted protein tyrosine phosphatase
MYAAGTGRSTAEVVKEALSLQRYNGSQEVTRRVYTSQRELNYGSEPSASGIGDGLSVC